MMNIIAQAAGPSSTDSNPVQNNTVQIIEELPEIKERYIPSSN
jgi:hypothetical protein